MTLKPDHVFIHPNYVNTLGDDSVGNPTMTHDFALIRLRTSAPSDLTPLPLATEEDMLNWALPGDEAVASGWGWTENLGASGISDVLQEVTLPILSQPLCEAIFGGIEMDSSSFCAGEVSGGGATCDADSGGPLTVNVHGQDIGIGLTSFGPANCDQHTSVFARVATVKDWVDEKLSLPVGQRCEWEQNPFTGSGGNGWHARTYRSAGECLHRYKNETYRLIGHSWFKSGTSYYY